MAFNRKINVIGNNDNVMGKRLWANLAILTPLNILNACNFINKFRRDYQIHHWKPIAALFLMIT